MQFLDRRTISILTTILVFAGFLGLVWLARFPIISFIFAIFFAQLLHPVVERFQAWFRVSRGKSVAITYLAIFGGLIIFGLTAWPRILDQAQHLSQTLPSLFENVRTGSIVYQIGGRLGWSAETEAGIQDWLVQHQNNLSLIAFAIQVRLQQLASNVPWILLVPILAAFFLKDSSRMRESFIDFIGHSPHRRFLERVIDDLDTMLGEYVRAQLLLCLFAFIAYGALLLIIGFPYALAVAAIGAILEFIPLVGPLLALAILIGIGLLTGYKHWIAVVAFWIVWRGIQDYVNAPRVMRRGLDLHPLLTIFAILVGGEIGGVIGIFLSIPIVAGLRILWVNWTGPTRRRDAA